MSLLAFVRSLDCLYTLPLIFATGMVYAASRHEDIHVVVRHGLRISAWIGGFMLISLFLMLILF